MEVFTEDDVYNPEFPATSEQKRIYKETERGQEIMCDIVQKIADDERAEGQAQLINQAVSNGYSIADIAKIFNMPVDMVLKMSKGQKA